MAGPGPWSVKGIDESTRAIARAAAQRAGFPIGVWLDRAILKTTETAGAPVAAAETTETLAGAVAGTTRTEASATNPVDGQPAELAALPPPAAPAREPARPVASRLDIPPGAKERADDPAIAAPPIRHRSGLLRYGIGGVLVFAAIGAGLAYIGDLKRGSPPPATVQVSASEREATAPAPPPKAATQAAITRSGAAPEKTAAPQREASTASGPTAVRDAQLKDLAARAATGDADAEYELGLRYSAGRDVPKDDRLAAEWFEKAAIHGLAPAQYNLGVLFERGQGVAKNAKKAFFWYQSAAAQHYARAEHNLATMYATGNGVAQNYQDAATWFSRAADAGVPESLYSLGLMYEHGLGVTRNLAIARSYYQRAADAGSAEARSKLAALGDVGPPTGGAIMTAAARLSAAVAPATGDGHAAAPGADRPLDRRGTAELQRLLARLDFAPGASDGVAGRRTVAAIRLYQEFAGLPIDGKPTVRLLNDIRDVSRNLGRPRP